MSFIIGLIAAITAPAPQQTLQTPAPRLERIEMEITSWGRSVSRWSIDARGNFTETRPEPDAFQPTRFVTRSYAAGTAGFRRMRVLLGTAETRAGHRLACTVAMTDAASGTIRWVQPNGRTGTLGFYSACRESATRQLITQIFNAQALADEWAGSGAITETRAGGPTS